MLGRAIWRRKWKIIVPTLLVAIAAAIVVQLLTPQYRSESRVLFEGRENVFLRPDAEKQLDRSVIDQEAVASQVQLLLSRDLARDVIKKLKLGERSEFDPVLNGVSPIKVFLAMIGIGKDPLRITPEERVLAAYYDRISVFPVEKSRVIGITFQSSSPELAAQVANTIATSYLSFQQAAKQQQARSAGQWLSGEIASLRKKVEEAEAKAEQFRAKSNLFVGTNNTTLSNQQLGEFTSQLAVARGQKADADVRARLIRDMLRSGKAIDFSDILNSELMRRLAEQRAGAQAQLAEQSSTLLGGHPRIKELKAQVADLDRAMRLEAERLARALENDARIAGARVESLAADFDRLKRQAASTNEQDVELRALEREAKAQRDLLSSYLAKYREATARDTIDSAPADARIISRAAVSNIPAFPKKLPIVVIAALAMLILSISFVATMELLKGDALRGVAVPAVPAVPAPVAPAPAGATGRASHPALGVTINAIDELARALRRQGPSGRRVTVIGATREVGATLTAITLARALAREAKVVLIDLSFRAPSLSAISSDPGAPGLAELVRGTASFGDIITRDRLSRAHVVAGGKDGDVAEIVASPRVATVLDALARAYDHVVIDAGTLPDVAPDRLARLAPRAVLVVGEDTDEAAEAARKQLVAAGFAEVTVIAGAPGAGEVADDGPRAAA
jgi:uncharacterized protein involved in exopolysaccharide biosynthesis